MSINGWQLSYWNTFWHGDTEETLVCSDCGATILGDGVPRVVKCAACWIVMRVVDGEGTVCHECFNADEKGDPRTVLQLADSDPDGFTCVRCGGYHGP